MTDVHLVPSPSKLPLLRNFIPGLLIGLFVLVGYAALPVTASLESVQHAPKPAVAEGPAVDTAAGRLDGENLFQAYITWLGAAHAHASLHGEDAHLPSQF